MNAETLEALALGYVGRYATSRAKLQRYLERKLGERGWDENSPPKVDAIVEQCSRLGYVDDRGYAAAKARSLVARGYGERRVGQQLYADGIDEKDAETARDIALHQRVASALAFARRKRIGPYALEWDDDFKKRERAVAAMLRAGHPIGLARKIVNMRPAEDIDEDALAGVT